MKAWRIAFLLWLGVAIGFLLIHVARAADTIACALYGEDVEKLVKLATNDDDVSQAARYAGERWCGVLDEPPLMFPKNVVEKPKNVALAPAPTGPAAATREGQMVRVALPLVSPRRRHSNPVGQTPARALSIPGMMGI